MGATTFSASKRVAKTVPTAEVFADLRSEALAHEGSGGYTGTIAEKTDFRMITEPGLTNEARLRAFIDQTLHVLPGQTTPYPDSMIDRICDKWGPASCVRLSVSDTEDEVVFFGMAPT